MMQTVSIADLKAEPLLSLWHLHIQPPAFDSIRAILAQLAPAEDSAMTLWQVDRYLYLLWALLYGLTIFLIYWWLSDITSIFFAAIAAILFSAHPALVFYATLLETTLLSALLILILCYLLWLIGKPKKRSRRRIGGFLSFPVLHPVPLSMALAHSLDSVPNLPRIPLAQAYSLSCCLITRYRPIHSQTVVHLRHCHDIIIYRLQSLQLIARL
jgi:hypothetical protein